MWGKPRGKHTVEFVGNEYRVRTDAIALNKKQEFDAQEMSAPGPCYRLAAVSKGDVHSRTSRVTL
jgi:hypothetical protein